MGYTEKSLRFAPLINSKKPNLKGDSTMTYSQIATQERTDARDATVREAKFWTCSRDEEQLSQHDIGEAVMDWAENDIVPPLPETVTVYGFAEMELPSVEYIAERVLSEIVEYLDDEYGDQINGDDTHITPAFREAARVFAEAVRREYPVWSCEEITSVEVKVADHVPAEWMTLPAPSAVEGPA